MFVNGVCNDYPLGLDIRKSLFQVYYNTTELYSNLRRLPKVVGRTPVQNSYNMTFSDVMTDVI